MSTADFSFDFFPGFKRSSVYRRRVAGPSDELCVSCCTLTAQTPEDSLVDSYHVLKFIFNSARHADVARDF